MRKILPKRHRLIPDNAVKVFSGVFFDAYQWPQTMFDGSVKTYEMVRRPDTVQIIAVKGDQIMLLEDEQPGRGKQVNLPGGRVEVSDGTWDAAARRELAEETGLVCRQWRLIDVEQPLLQLEWFAPLYVASDIIEEREQRLDEGGEHITPRWEDYAVVRERVLAGAEPRLRFLVPVFYGVRTTKELLGLPEYTGASVDR